MLLSKPERWWHAPRYCCGPPVSEEDLWTYVGGPKFKRVSPAWAEQTAAVFRLFVLLSVSRGWLTYETPRGGTRTGARSHSNAARVKTIRYAGPWRGIDSSGTAVAAMLSTAGFQSDHSRSEIRVLDDMARGSFSRERRVAGEKGDVPLRLHDGRLLAIECKSSNGPKNGWEARPARGGGEGGRWARAFGTQVVTAAVLPGVYDLAVLSSARERNVATFWEHHLPRSFISRPAPTEPG